MVADYLNTLKMGRKFEFVPKPDRDQDGLNLVITIGPEPFDPEAQVDLGRRP